MVIIMFDPSALDLPAYEYFEMMYRNFEYNFAMTFDENGDIKYILRTYNSVADDFLLMEEEARKSIMDDPKSASIVRKRYHSSNMEAMIKAAKECGIQLDVPDFVS